MIAVASLVWAFTMYQKDSHVARAQLVEAFMVRAAALLVLLALILLPFRASYHADYMGAEAVLAACTGICENENACLMQNPKCLEALRQSSEAMDMTYSIDIALWVIAIL